jgi:hypothetical protein
MYAEVHAGLDLLPAFDAHKMPDMAGFQKVTRI